MKRVRGVFVGLGFNSSRTLGVARWQSTVILVALISGHRDVATVCFDKIATLTQINADNFLHFLVARLPIQHGGGANYFTDFLAKTDEKETAIASFLIVYR